MKSSLCAILGICLTYNFIIAISAEEEKGFMECILEANSASCARKSIAKEIDQIELEVSGKRSDVPMSVVLEKTGHFIADGINNLLSFEKTEGVQDNEAESRGLGRFNFL